MYSIYCSAIISIAFFIVLSFSLEDYYSLLDKIGNAILYGILGCIIGVFLGLIFAICSPKKYKTETITKNIVSLQDNNGTSGQFFLGCGSIDGSMKYTFYYEENGFYKMEQLNYNNVKLKYSDSVPKVTYTIKRIIKDNWSIGWGKENRNYIIYIPKGTIKTNYNLDAQ